MASMDAQPPAQPKDLAWLLDRIVAAGRRLGARGLISASEGNISVLLADGNLVVTPTGRRKDELGPGDLLIVPSIEEAATPDADGPRPSSDIAIHRAIYATRPDVMAVVHAHLPASMALTLAGEAPDPEALPETALFVPRLPLIPFATPGSAELAAHVARALTEGPEPLPGAVLLERHGAVAVGASVDEAINRLELVEVLCRTWRDALLIRGAIAGPGAGAILRPPSMSRRDR
jgi:L-fuculose-phosphate aldolase